jgi:biotin carboxyl carrier protein
MIYKVTLNNKIYEVDVVKGEAIIKAEYEAALPKTETPAAAPLSNATPAAPAATPAAAPAAPASGAKALRSPLPGNINAIKVSEGQTVKAGDVLLILEAMKMENEITADRAGTIGKIFVAKGNTVQTGAPLLEIL